MAGSTTATTTLLPHYALLGCAHDGVDRDALKALYLAKAAALREAHDQPGFLNVSRAFYVLNNNEKRAAYDSTRGQSPELRSEPFNLKMANAIFAKLIKEAAGADENNEDEAPQVWVPYMPSISVGGPHPGHIVEASVLAGIKPKPNPYPITDSLGTQVEKALLSRMQLEGIMSAAERHLHFIGDSKTRAGFYLGDSAGVGKGRQLAGLILDNLVRGRKKNVWLSVSADLYADAERDFRDIGCSAQVIRSIEHLTQLSAHDRDRPSALFVTYRELISQGSNNTDKTRLDQLADWLGEGLSDPADAFEGLIILDEAHKAKNFDEMSEKGGTLTGKNVVDLQRRFPRARVVYSSATCVSHVDDMAYMERLGYWGEGTTFRSFGEFKDLIGMCQVSGMELLAMDMKRTGRALVRNVSYEGAQFQVLQSKLSPAVATTYSAACALWEDIFIKLKAAVRRARGMPSPGEGGQGKSSKGAGKTKKPKSSKRAAILRMGGAAYWERLLFPELFEGGEEFGDSMDDGGDYHDHDDGEEENNEILQRTGAQFWAAHQRFFAQFILAIKVDACVNEAKAALEAGHCVVVGLQSTGEAALKRAVEDEGLDPEQGTRGIVSVCKSIVRRFLLTQFPVDRDDDKFAKQVGKIHYAFYQPEKRDVVHEIALLVRRHLASPTHSNPQKSKSMLLKRILAFAFDETRAKQCLWPMYNASNQLVESLRDRNNLLNRLEGMHLPPSALDLLIDKLGGPDMVAEMTGRTERQVRDPKTGLFFVEARDGHKSRHSAQSSSFAGSSSSSASAFSAHNGGGNGSSSISAWGADAADVHVGSLNIEERVQFMQGKKLVAVISEAASTGISLHADRNVSETSNRRRRVHITLQLPWAADQAIQQLGRTHRSNQLSAPIYVLVSSGLGGENRFVSSVARRLSTLGAITQGDRRASLGAMSLGEFLYESKQGEEALWAMMQCTLPRKTPGEKQPPPPEMVEGTSWETVVEQSRDMIELDRVALAEDGGGEAWRTKRLGSSSSSSSSSSKKAKRGNRGGLDGEDDMLLLEDEEQDTTEDSQDVVELLRVNSEEDFLGLVASSLRCLHLTPDSLGEDPSRRRGRRRGAASVSKFLNRILGLPFSCQTILFNYFVQCLDAAIARAKRSGVFDGGIRDLHATHIQRQAPRVNLVHDPRTNNTLQLETLHVDRVFDFFLALRELRYHTLLAQGVRSVRRETIPGIDPLMQNEDISKILDDAKSANVGGFAMSKHPNGRGFDVLMFIHENAEGKSVRTFRPHNGGGWRQRMSVPHFELNCRPCFDIQAIHKEWNKWSRPGKSDNSLVNQHRFSTVYLLTGSLVPFLQTINQSVVGRNEDDADGGEQEDDEFASRGSFATFAVNLTEGDKDRIVGIACPEFRLAILKQNCLALQQALYQRKLRAQVPVRFLSMPAPGQMEKIFGIRVREGGVVEHSRNAQIAVGGKVVGVNDWRFPEDFPSFRRSQSKQAAASSSKDVAGKPTSLEDIVREWMASEYDAIRATKGDGQTDPPEHQHVEVTLCVQNPDNAWLEDRRSSPSPVNEALLERISFNPKKKRRDHEKIKKLFDDDGDDISQILRLHVPAHEEGAAAGGEHASGGGRKRKSVAGTMGLEEGEEATSKKKRKTLPATPSSSGNSNGSPDDNEHGSNGGVKRLPPPPGGGAVTTPFPLQPSREWSTVSAPKSKSTRTTTTTSSFGTPQVTTTTTATKPTPQPQVIVIDEDDLLGLSI